MNEQEKCICPFCSGSFIPEAGLTADEYLAIGMIKTYGEMQRKNTGENPLPCPRCGCGDMSPVLENNALSRIADVYICDLCGMEEAIRAATLDTQSLKQWHFIIGMNKLINKKGET